MKNQTIKIDESIALTRLDKVLVETDQSFTRTRIKHLIDEGFITVNNEPTKPSYKVKTDDVITIRFPEEKTIDLTPVDLGLDIVYEDEDLLVVNKPSGLIVHPTETSQEDTLVHGLLYHIKDLQPIDDTLRPGIVHRIDKETSGLLVVAKNKPTLLALQTELKAQKTQREYVALVEGVIQHNKGKIDAPVGRHPKDRQNMTVTGKGKESVTYFEVLERFEAHTLVQCTLESGRTHQIRVHMQFINHPIVGDPKYGLRKTDTSYGQYLHAKTLGFTHPKTKAFMSFSKDLPDFFLEKLESLRG